MPEADAVAVANQLGRLDLVTVLLAFVAIILAASAIPMFFYLRYRAGEAAKAEVTERMDAIQDRLEAEAISKMEEMLPMLVRDYLPLIRNEVTPESANDIAGAQDDDGTDKPLSDHSGGPE